MIDSDLEVRSHGQAFDTDSKSSTAASNYNALWLWSIWPEIMTIEFLRIWSWMWASLSQCVSALLGGVFSEANHLVLLAYPIVLGGMIGH